MSIQLIGISYVHTPVALREKFAIPEARLREVMQELVRWPGISEGMVLSTCNRVEVLVNTCADNVDLRGFLCKQAGVKRSECDQHIYEYGEQEAVRHLFRVTASLDSMVFGEPQILGQVKLSYMAAKEIGAIRSDLERLLTCAFAVAKRVRTQTSIGSASVSIASVAADLAVKIFGPMSRTRLLLVGAGKMSELAARHLLAHGVTSIVVANRTYQTAQALARKFDGQAIPYEELYETGHQADIVITATGAESAIFLREHGELFLARRRNRPMLFIDVAVPRNVDPALEELDGIFVYNIDALQHVASANAQKRQHDASRAEIIINKEVEHFYSRMEARRAVPTILSMQQHFEMIRQHELQHARRRLASLTPEQYAAVEALTRGMLNKVMHAPLSALRIADERERESMLRLFQCMFNLEGTLPSRLRSNSTNSTNSLSAPRKSGAA